MSRHKNLCAIADCSVLERDSNGKIPSNINVTLVMLNEKGFFFFAVAWEAIQFYNQLQMMVLVLGQ